LIVFIINAPPFESFEEVDFLLRFQYLLVEKLLNLLVSKVDAWVKKKEFRFFISESTAVESHQSCSKLFVSKISKPEISKIPINVEESEKGITFDRRDSASNKILLRLKRYFLPC
jgi:hypothetical protein